MNFRRRTHSDGQRLAPRERGQRRLARAVEPAEPLNTWGAHPLALFAPHRSQQNRHRALGIEPDGK
jgi:hypothetical protein